MIAEELSKKAFPILSPLQSGTEDVVRLSDALAAVKKLCEENERLRRENKILDLKCAASLANNLCPDHRDKQRGKTCLACTIEVLTRDLAAARGMLRSIEFSSRAYCPVCDGWNVEKGRGATPRAHTKDCALARILAAAPAKEPSNE